MCFGNFSPSCQLHQQDVDMSCNQGVEEMREETLQHRQAPFREAQSTSFWTQHNRRRRKSVLRR
eukprot:2125613-Amphidinium_carterae.1